MKQTSHLIISHNVISYHIISYHIISYHIISYHIISYHIISCQTNRICFTVFKVKTGVSMLIRYINKVRAVPYLLSCLTFVKLLYPFYSVMILTSISVFVFYSWHYYTPFSYTSLFVFFYLFFPFFLFFHFFLFFSIFLSSNFSPLSISCWHVEYYWTRITYTYHLTTHTLTHSHTYTHARTQRFKFNAKINPYIPDFKRGIDHFCIHAGKWPTGKWPTDWPNWYPKCYVFYLHNLKNMSSLFHYFLAWYFMLISSIFLLLVYAWMFLCLESFIYQLHCLSYFDIHLLGYDSHSTT